MNEPTTNNRQGWKKAAVFVLVAAIAAFFYFQFGDQLRLSSLAEKEQLFRSYRAEHPVLVYAIAWVAYVTITGLSLPGAAVLTLVYGWFFGFTRTLILVSFASTTGATLAFLLSRYLFRDAIEQRFGKRLEAFNKNLEQQGAFYLFTLRLIVGVPFFVINVVMGLTPMKTSTFWWVSQLGMLPGTAAFVYAGSSVPDLKTLADTGVSGILTPRLVIAFAVLAAFPWFAKWALNRSKRAAPVADAKES